MVRRRVGGILPAKEKKIEFETETWKSKANSTLHNEDAK